MRFPSLPSLLLLLFLAVPALTSAQTPAAPASIVFTFEHPQLQPSQYTLTFDETGAGHFTSKPGPDTDAGDDVMPSPLDRPIRLDDPLRSDLFGYAREHSFFATRCATTQTSLAFTGDKSLTYTGPDGSGSCKFVWAGDPALQHMVDDLESVAFTLEEGRRLDIEVLHDRLGLDAELETLQDAVRDRRALDLANIADQLRAVAGDQRVMDRARKRAMDLLARSRKAEKSR